MKMYFRLAFTNIINNRRLYVPHMLTGAGLMAVFYIMLTLSFDDRLKNVKGGSYLPSIMGLGLIIVGIVSVILMLYTNSFLMKQRQSEFGLYNVLGMEKRHIGRILFCETLISGTVALLAGLTFGIILYKICALLICRILKVESVLGFYHVTLTTVLPSLFIFVAMYGAIFVFNRIRIALLKPAQLLQSTHEGEKEPRTKWLVAVIGFLTLGAGYFLALKVDNPLAALKMFFVAVILVIIGTYCLFTAGSIVVLKAMRRNKKFYYSSKNMIAVSGMLYRMKQNAAGLASIAILATCVLVMISSTVTLYASIEDTLRKEYPYEMKVSAMYHPAGDEEIPAKDDSHEQDGDPVNHYEELNSASIPLDDLRVIVEKAARENGLEVAEYARRRYLAVSYKYTDDGLICYDNNYLFDGITMCFFMTGADYNSITGEAVTLGPGEALVYSAGGNALKVGKELKISGINFSVSGTLKSFPVSMSEYSIATCFGIVVPDEETLYKIYDIQQKEYGRSASDIDDCLMVNFSDPKAAEEKGWDIYRSVRNGIEEYISSVESADEGYSMSSDTVWSAREAEYGLLGTLMFLGIILSVVFIMATALIIYYKQVSEGYEDRERFHIMQKVGMSGTEVKSAIRGQVLAVFFMPLLVAALHLTMASPMITKLMKILFLPGNLLFILCMVAAFVLFSCIYVVIYILTARMYYHIVTIYSYNR